MLTPQLCLFVGLLMLPCPSCLTTLSEVVPSSTATRKCFVRDVLSAAHTSKKSACTFYGDLRLDCYTPRRTAVMAVKNSRPYQRKGACSSAPPTTFLSPATSICGDGLSPPYRETGGERVHFSRECEAERRRPSPDKGAMIESGRDHRAVELRATWHT